MADERIFAADLFARALRCGEASAARTAARHLSPDVLFRRRGRDLIGKEAVVAELTTISPFSPVLAKGIWSPAERTGDQVSIAADFGTLGAAPREYRLRFEYDDRHLVGAVQESFSFPTQPERQSRIPPYIRSILNSALGDGRPVTVAYVTDQGKPSLSLRGSVQVLGDMELCAWIRNPNGGLARVARAAGPVSLLYRDSTTRTTLVFEATAGIEDDPAVRQCIYELVPEVEQTHDPAMNGAALVFRVEKIVGTHPLGPVLVERES